MRRCARRRPFGFTLMELLVVMVLVSLLGTLLVQGIGLFASRFDDVQRIHRQAAHAALPQSWFIASVQGLVAYGVDARRLRGDAGAFAGITLQPLRGAPSVPATARWSIDGRSVFYAEDAAEAWRMFTVADDAGALAFEYADAAGVWHDRWPVAHAPEQRVPASVRLVSADAGPLWLAHVPATPQPVLTEENFR